MSACKNALGDGNASATGVLRFSRAKRSVVKNGSEREKQKKKSHRTVARPCNTLTPNRLAYPGHPPTIYWFDRVRVLTHAHTRTAGNRVFLPPSLPPRVAPPFPLALSPSSISLKSVRRDVMRFNLIDNSMPGPKHPGRILTVFAKTTLRRTARQMSIDFSFGPTPAVQLQSNHGRFK